MGGRVLSRQSCKGGTATRKCIPCIVSDGSVRLPASYANFYIGNGAVVVPVFGHPNDQRALAILQKRFPGRRVVGVDSTAMVYGLGTIQCCSQQEPKVGRGSV